MIKNKTSIEKAILCLLAIIFFAIYLSLSFSKNVWTDEAFTIDLIKRSIPGIIKGTAIDVHPPLYYLIAKIPVSIFGQSLIGLKLVSMLPILLLMTAGAYKLYRLFSFNTAAYFIVFLGIIPCITEYALQLRMYSWAIFFVTWMGIEAYCFFIEGRLRDMIILALMGACAAYTHYFAFVSALWIYGFLFLAICAFNTARIRGWILGVLVSGLLYAPWLKVLSQQVGSVSESYWIEKITAKTILDFLPFLFDNTIPASTGIWTGLLIVSLLYYIQLLIRKQGQTEAIFGIACMLVPIATVITGVVVSNLLRPIFIIRYVVPCLGLIALSIGMAVDGLLKNREKRIGDVSRSVLILFFLISAFVNYKNAYRLEYTWCKTYETLDFFAKHFQTGEKIIYNYTPYDFVYQCYWDEGDLISVEDLDFDEDISTYWLIDTVYWPKPDEEDMAAHGYTSEYMGNFGIEHNDFKIYKISKS